MKSDSEWQLKEKALVREVQAVRLDHHVWRPPVPVVMQGFLKMKRRNQALKSGEIKTCSSLSQQASIHKIPGLYSCSFKSMSPNTLPPASVSQTPSVNFKTVMFPSLGSGSSSSAYSRALCFRNSTSWTSVGAWSWQFGNSKTSAAS